MPLIHKQQPCAVLVFVGVAALASFVACSKDNNIDTASTRPGAEPEAKKPEASQPEVRRPDDDGEPANAPAGVGADWANPDSVPLQITAVVIDVGLADLCGIERAKAFFEYDSAKLSSEGEQIATKIAACFTDGPLKGQELRIVGHADPRGSDAYNKQLGKSRAESVAEVLFQKGVTKRRVEVESQGEAQAHEDPDKWPLDRRVELRVGS
ncbi:18K peptidoglycan-associated outer membrane lipoprotein [Enhygromyxa salina]|uniref:18K peptidoglycan-associated outer membrane lipoprotein n=1 Tax=Enhygromyxa salina TaxID=215803 RepID=A0A0C2D6D6_9BACT|nr:OmpA family protein [Enhygromyxa salina]KIG18706.1 18K peptidoglycan-associated outer membrane lipoprotein [Enhygromyxa salina]